MIRCAEICPVEVLKFLAIPDKSARSFLHSEVDSYPHRAYVGWAFSSLSPTALGVDASHHHDPGNRRP